MLGGDEYALKEPLEELRRSGQFNLKSWKKEADIMKSVSHDHIVSFRGAEFSPWPQLSFEFIRGGNLASINTSTSENVRILIQLLSALTYLHDLEIAHRDIKPANILVLYQRLEAIYIKFGDFGLAKNGAPLQTFCGTLLYAAPEIYAGINKRNNKSYSFRLDVWSLGATIAQKECGFPAYLNWYQHSDDAWANAMVMHVEGQSDGDELLSFILEKMLVIDPEQRKPAEDCYEGSLRLSNGKRDLPSPYEEGVGDDESDAETPKAATHFSSNYESEASTIRPSPRVDGSTDTSSQASVTSSELIRELGERGSDFLDSLLGRSSVEATFIRLEALEPDSQPQQGLDGLRSSGTVLGGGLWTMDETAFPAWNEQLEQDEPTNGSGGDGDAVQPQALDLSFLIRHRLGAVLQSRRPEEERDGGMPEATMVEGTVEPASKRRKLGNDDLDSVRP